MIKIARLMISKRMSQFVGYEKAGLSLKLRRYLILVI